MTIQKFEVGKWYRWIGPTKADEVLGLDCAWNPEMRFILDGKPHKCIRVYAPPEEQPALWGCRLPGAFEGQPGDPPNYVWSWGGTNTFFEEVPPDFKKGKT
jgi:hypothetical protein